MGRELPCGSQLVWLMAIIMAITIAQARPQKIELQSEPLLNLDVKERPTLNLQNSSTAESELTNESLNNTQNLQGRQEEDGEEEVEQNAFTQFISALPSFLRDFNAVSGALNQGLNGTATPNLQTFLLQQGQQVSNFLNRISLQNQVNEAALVNLAVSTSNGFQQALAAQNNQSVLINQTATNIQAAQNFQNSVNNQPTPSTQPILINHVPQKNANDVRLPGSYPQIYIPESIDQPIAAYLPNRIVNRPVPANPMLDTKDYIGGSVKPPSHSSIFGPTYRPGISRPNTNQLDTSYNHFEQNEHQGHYFGARTTEAPVDDTEGSSSMPWNILINICTHSECIKGTLKEFNLVNPAAFSKGMLQSISLTLANIDDDSADVIDRPTLSIRGNTNSDNVTNLKSKQLLQNLAPGKPVYWMGKLYPNGLPMKKVTYNKNSSE